MQCKSKIKYYWNCNVEIHQRYYSIFKKEEELWARFLMDKLGCCQKVLEMGCGTGNLTRILEKTGYDVTAVDISSQMLKKFEGINGCSKLLGDAETPSFKENSFDAIICRNLMCTLPKPGRALQKWFDILRENGRLCIIDKLDTGVNMRETLGVFLTLMLERRNLWRLGYAKDIASSIPFHQGFKPEILQSLILDSGFEEVEVDRMDAINTARMVTVPFHYNLLLEQNLCVTARKQSPNK